MKTSTMCLMLLVALVTFLQVYGASSARLEITPFGDSHMRSIGRVVVFTCSALGLPETVDPKLKWTDPEGDEIIDAQERVYIETDGDQALKLYITQIESGDAGYYTCSGHFEGHRVSKQTELRIFQDITFENAPAEQHAKLFSDALITCIVRGQPQPTVLWKFQGRTIQAGGRYTYKTNGLLIRNITEEDSGQYTCRAEVAAEGRLKERRIDVIVERPPRFESDLPTVAFGSIGKRTNISCVALGNPEPIIMWGHKKGWIRQSNETFRVFSQGRKSVLQITVLPENQNWIFGQYTCQAINVHGRNTLDIQLQRAKSTAKVEITPEGDTLVRGIGSSVMFTCSLSGLPRTVNPQLSWTDVQGNNITDTTGTVFIRVDGNQTLHLFIRDIDYGDEGYYTCSALLDGNRVSKKKQLLLFKDITFENSPAHQHPESNSDALIRCSVTGQPMPTVSWRYRGRRIQTGGRYEITPDGLVIKDITEEDNGRYICRAEVATDGRLKEKEINVHVPKLTAKLEITPGGDTLVRGIGSSVMFTCSVSGLPRTVNPQLRWTDVQGNEITGTTGMVFIRTDGDQTLHLFIRDIDFGNEGYYTCSSLLDGNRVSKKKQLLLFKDITFENAPAEQFPEIYSDALIKCSVSGQPLPTVSWRYRGRRIQTGDRYEITPDGLVIKDITEEDSGNYICRAEVATDGRLKEKEIYVHVQKSAAEIGITPGGDTHVRATGSSVRFICSVSGLERTVNPQLKWTDEKGNDITNTEGAVFIRRKGDHTLYLFMLNIDTENEGFYKCSGILGGHRISKKMQLRLFKDITFENAPAHQSPKINSDALIRCTVRGRPVPTVTWRYRGRTIQTGSRYEITTDGLVIKNITEDDNGTYICRAEVATDGRLKQKEIEVEVQSSGP